MSRILIVLMLAGCTVPADKEYRIMPNDSRCTAHYPISYGPGKIYRCELFSGEICYFRKDGGLSCFYKPSQQSDPTPNTGNQR